MVERGRDEVPYPVAMQRIAMPACTVIAVLVALGVIHEMTGQPAPVIAAAATALAVALAGIGWTVAGRSATPTLDLFALIAARLAARGRRAHVRRLRAGRPA